MIGSAGCANPKSQPENEAVTVPVFAGGADVLSPGDPITITFSGNSNAPNFPHEEIIAEDGTIEPPLLGMKVMAAEKRVGELRDELHSLYVPDYFKTLTVTIQTEARFFFVGGSVRQPGQIPYLSEMTVLKAVQAAGDFNQFANHKKVELRRDDGGQVLVIDCKKARRDSKLDVPVYPGDIIYVPQRLY